MRAENIENKLKNILRINLKSALFSLEFWAIYSGFWLFCVLDILKAKIKIQSVFT
jgi:hypothetical protein